MNTYYKTDQMSGLISDDYRMLQILSRFGICLGFGDQSVEAACKASGVDCRTFLAVVNYVKNAGHAHINELKDQVNLPDMLTYLKNSHAYFVDFRLPAIRRKLIASIDCATNNQIAFLILKFYDEYAQEVQRHMEYENTHVHPYVEMLLQGKMPRESFRDDVNEHEGNHASLEKSISELKSMIIKYYPNEANAQLLNDALMDIYMVEEDLLMHCQLEDTLFAACVRQLEAEVRERGGAVEEEAVEEETTGDANGGETLSEREKEVIVQVVRGLSNKEIAEQMFISPNTVMTHRRNISRKLNIRSAAGLTIYAIVNGLVKLEDVKL